MGKRRNKGKPATTGKHLYKYTVSVSHRINTSQNVFISSDCWADNLLDLVDLHLCPRYEDIYDITGVKIEYFPMGKLNRRIDVTRGKFVPFDSFVDNLLKGGLNKVYGGSSRKADDKPEGIARPNTYEIQAENTEKPDITKKFDSASCVEVTLVMPAVFNGIPDYMVKS